jgi:hypothetical protein
MNKAIHYVRSCKAQRPTQQEIKEALDKANSVTRTALCKCVLPDIYTR